jgi:hypothetical protein
MSFSDKSHPRDAEGNFLDPLVQSTKIDCQAADDGMTEQAHKDEVSIQNIVKRAQRGEPIPQVENAQWGVDTLGQPDFDQAQNIIANTQAMFEQLPSQIRTMCGNNPGNFLEFYEDPDNINYLKKAGLDVSHLEEQPKAAPQVPPEGAQASPEGATGSAPAPASA